MTWYNPIIRSFVFIATTCLMFSNHATASKVTSSQIFILEDADRSFNVNQVYQHYKAGHFTLFKGINFNPGFTKSVYWLAVKVPPQKDSTYIIIGNAHINLIDFYHLENNHPVIKYQTGDHLKFRSRPISYRLFVFPLRIGSIKDDLYLVRVDKHNESLQLSVEISKTYLFYQKVATYNLLTGILWGGVLLLIVFGLFLFIIVKDTLYLYYVLYISFVCLWVIADKGYGFQYLWPDSTYFASRSRAVFNSLFLTLIIQFMQSFIGQTPESRLYKPIKWIKIILLLKGTLFLTPINYLEYTEAVEWLLIFSLVAGVLCMALMTLSLVEKIKEGNKQAWFYVISTIALLIFAMSEIMIHAGTQGLAGSYLSNFGVQTGITIEATILIFGLAYRFNTYRKDREMLLIAVNKKQEQLTSSILETQESERRKIADQLHDDVGAMLSIATLQVSTALDKRGYSNEKTIEKLGNAQDVLKDISQTIRTLSHTLTPWAIEKYGIKKALSDLIYKINLSDKIELESTMLGFDNPDHYPVYFLNDIFRIIQELLNNILKHANASHAYLEIIEHTENITIIIEDNGKGFLEQSEVVKGKGLESIYSKIAFYEGQIELKSTPERGTTAIIELPGKKANSENIITFEYASGL